MSTPSQRETRDEPCYSGGSCPECEERLVSVSLDREECPACGTTVQGGLAPSEAGGRLSDRHADAIEYVVMVLDRVAPRTGGADLRGRAREAARLIREGIRPAYEQQIASRPTGEDSARTLHARLDAYEGVFRWLLGEEGDFPARPERAEGKPYPYYYWRTPLRWKLEHARGSATPSRPESDNGV